MAIHRTLRHRIAHSTAAEPLEARIAPALLVNGANLLGGSAPNSGETSVGGNSVELVRVLSGQALVWFDNGIITGISVGPNVSLEITGDILGDIVGNLRADGRLSDSDNDPSNGDDGGVLLPNDILGLKTRKLSSQDGDIVNVFTGGSISNVSISGQIDGIYAGDGVFRNESRLVNLGTVQSSLSDPLPTGLDINPVIPGVQDTFSFTKAGSSLVGGASIRNVHITKAGALQMYSGNGNPAGTVLPGVGPNGGNIENVTIETAFVEDGQPEGTPSYALITGDGASGKSGGAGGRITKILERTSSGPVLLQAGHGGVGTQGAGGAGGSITLIDLQSDSSLYNVKAGNGGVGTPGGAGGDVQNSNFANRTPVAGVILSADFNNDGFDDILVADAGTGDMVVNINDGTGTGFFQLDQGNGSAIIPGVGQTPVGAVSGFFNNDSFLDLAVIYKNSNSIGIYLNEGDGRFLDLGEDKFASQNFGIGFAPQSIAYIGTRTFLVSGSDEDGKGTVNFVSTIPDSPDEGALVPFVLGTVDSSKAFPQPIADVAVAGSRLFMAQTNGVISELDFDLAPITSVSVRGGVTDLDVDSTGTNLLALSSVGRTLSIFDLSGDLNAVASETVSLATFAGRPVVAKFVHDSNPETADDIVVLNTLANGSRFDIYTKPLSDGDPATQELYSRSDLLESSSALKNFVPGYTNGTVGLAALASSLNTFTFIHNFGDPQRFPLPFASKEVIVTAGNGGDGVDLGTKLGKGGQGGGVSAINADAQKIVLTAGNGGNSQNGAAGAGGALSNPTAFTTFGGGNVAPRLRADSGFDDASGNDLKLTAGDGGTPSGQGPKAAGGAGGILSGFVLEQASGDMDLTAGNAGAGKGGAGGTGGEIKGITTLMGGGNLTVTAGNGGATTGTGIGGKGGSITGVRHELKLEPTVEDREDAYSVTLIAGHGASSDQGAGGAGGAVANIVLRLDGSDRTFDNPNVDPPLVDAHRDSTVRISITSGNGGNGGKGGFGGAIQGIDHQSIYDQVNRDGTVRINYVTMQLTAGQGGNGSAGNGGDGGGIIFGTPISGITFFDRDSATPFGVPLIVRAGNAGNGSAKGGHGGSVVGLIAQNAPFDDNNNLTQTHLWSALIEAGNGGAGGTGDGGKGGSVSRALIGIQQGFMEVFGGQGGASANARGGMGGCVISSEFGVVSSDADLGMLIVGGDGGAGKTLGGIGGLVSDVRINTPQSTLNLSAALFGGDGGAVNSATGIGGKGGDVMKITQAKDVNSSINVIQAGNGGDNPLGKAGAGGNIAAIRTVGFIGRPSDGLNLLGVFDDLDSGPGVMEVAQGLFSGRGGNGLTDGVNGSVKDVVARQIAAISAAYDSITGLFGVASSVAKVKADLIGFDEDADGQFDDIDGAPAESPAVKKPIDGFILAAALASVTGQRPGFVFNA